MTILKTKILLITLFAIGLALSSCGSKSSNATNTKQISNNGIEYTSAYICPMHCEGSGSDMEGNCPVCEMDYVKNEDHNASGHNH